MIVGTNLKRTQIETHYDAIVIGSGIGGLATASFLAQKGKKVLVLEQHYTAGGFTHSYTRKGYEWDVGLHYIGEVHKSHTAMRKLFDAVTNGKLQWNYLDELYDKIIFPDQFFEFVAGWENLQNNLIQSFPEEREAIENYFALIKKVSRTFSFYFCEKLLPLPLAKILHPFLGKPFLSYANKTTWEVLSSLTQNEKLIGVLCGQWGDYGLPPKSSSFAMHVVLVKHYLAGGNYPVGGASQIAHHIVPTIESSGGKVVTSAAVKELLFEKKKAVGVLLDDNKKIYGKKIISNAGIHTTFNKLIPRNLAEEWGLPELMKQVTSSESHLCLYLGLNKSAESLNLQQTNLWIYPSYNHEKNLEQYQENREQDFPLVYISFPSAKDPDWNKRYPNKATIEIITLGPYEWFKKWEESSWGKRGEEYNQLKEKFSQRLLDILYQHCPQVKGHVDYYELSTPLSTKFFSGYENGEIYGLNHDPSRFALKWLRPSSPIKNLYFTGQDVCTAGVGGALAGGALTAVAILGFFRGRHILKMLRGGKKKESQN